MDAAPLPRVSSPERSDLRISPQVCRIIRQAARIYPVPRRIHPHASRMNPPVPPLTPRDSWINPRRSKPEPQYWRNNPPGYPLSRKPQLTPKLIEIKQIYIGTEPKDWEIREYCRAFAKPIRVPFQRTLSKLIRIVLELPEQYMPGQKKLQELFLCAKAVSSNQKGDG